MLTSLGTLLRTDRPADAVVAFGSERSRVWSDFVAHVAALRARIAAEPADRWLVFSDDAYAFAVAVLAVAHQGGVAVLPPNGQVGTLNRLADSVGGAIVDRELGLAVPEITPLQSGGPSPVWSHLDRDADFVEFFTSGTTGGGKRIGKCLRHIDDELAELEQVFGDDVAGARVFATVSHQHIYGALFRALWPLAAGRPFSAATYLHGSEVAAAVAGGPAVLVSTPVQLKSMAASAALKGSRIGAVFSSGAPLDGNTAIAVYGMLGVAPTEVFGSTETGGVAWRRRPAGGDERWRPLPSVAIDTDEHGALRVRSPFASAGGPEGFVMGDRVEIESGGFRLRGRVDRIVKIGSKRLSLPDMEEELTRQPSVDDAALLVLRRGMEDRVGAVVALNEHGRAELTSLGKSGLGKQLGDVLSEYFDRVLLPRAWRFVDELPRNTQGKLPESELRALFDGDGEAAVRDPVVESEAAADRWIEQQCVVPENLAYFDGHFDEFALVPGVVQIRWAVALAERVAGRPLEVTTIEALKFKQPLIPGARFVMRVEVEGGKARFRFTRDGAELSSGRLTVEGS